MSVRSELGGDELHALKLPPRYEIRRHIATGGMASVWCAEDVLLGRSVAIKLLVERFALEELAVSRFKREARAAARVSGHPHVVTIYDVDEAEPANSDVEAARRAPTGRAFIVMEYLAGGTVADALRVGAVTRQEALRWLREAASALDHAHQCGVVHRDIKPANFLLNRARVLHVADFGIARLGSEDTLTGTGELFGTAAYLSPEQALGGRATAASDRYALAVAAFELLVGERPFIATHFAAQARQHIEQEPPRASASNRTLAPAVDAVLARGMAKRPEDRWPTAGDFVQAVEEALGGTARANASPDPRESIPAPRRASSSPMLSGSSPMRSGSSPMRSGSSPRRAGRAVALAALAVVTLVVGLVTGESQEASPARTPVLAQVHPATTRHLAAKPTRATARPRSTPAAPASAVVLEARGHELMVDGEFATAIPTLRRAIETADPSSPTYGYALYDLGRSLVFSGDAKAAVPILEQRLRIPDHTEIVQQELDIALQASGSAPNTPAGTSGGSGSGGEGSTPQSGGDRAATPSGGGGSTAKSGGAGLPSAGPGGDQPKPRKGQDAAHQGA